MSRIQGDLLMPHSRGLCFQTCTDMLHQNLFNSEGPVLAMDLTLPVPLLCLKCC